MEQMYQEVILDHYKHPHGRGLREPFGAEVHHVNPTCGDEVTLRVAVSEDGATVEGSVLMPGVRVGKGAVVRRAILDKNVVVGEGEIIGVDLERDRQRFAVSNGGVVTIGKGVWI